MYPILCLLFNWYSSGFSASNGSRQKIVIRKRAADHFWLPFFFFVLRFNLFQGNSLALPIFKFIYYTLFCHKTIWQLQNILRKWPPNNWWTWRISKVIFFQKIKKKRRKSFPKIKMQKWAMKGNSNNFLA